MPLIMQKNHTADIAIWLLKSKILSQKSVFCEGGRPLTKFDICFTFSIAHYCGKVKWFVKKISILWIEFRSICTIWITQKGSRW